MEINQNISVYYRWEYRKTYQNTCFKDKDHEPAIEFVKTVSKWSSVTLAEAASCAKGCHYN